ncbi:MAG: nucleoside triphosphatase YtkD [Staphylococcus lugdunensis]|nr:nucleoside triphosphatase YtkD [Staphylococcus lugdunensis]
MQFLDKENRRVILTYKNDKDIANGNHVLAIPFYKQQLLFTQHKVRGIEFPGGKREEGETSMEAIKRELFEETGAQCQKLTYIAQYEVFTKDKTPFVKDVYAIEVSRIDKKNDYLETTGPILYQRLNDIPENKRSYLIQDAAIQQCLERVKLLGLYSL